MRPSWYMSSRGSGAYSTVTRWGAGPGRRGPGGAARRRGAHRAPAAECAGCWWITRRPTAPGSPAPRAPASPAQCTALQRPPELAWPAPKTWDFALSTTQGAAPGRPHRLCGRGGAAAAEGARLRAAGGADDPRRGALRTSVCKCWRWYMGCQRIKHSKQGTARPPGGQTRRGARHVRAGSKCAETFGRQL